MLCVHPSSLSSWALSLGRAWLTGLGEMWIPAETQNWYRNKEGKLVPLGKPLMDMEG